MMINKSYKHWKIVFLMCCLAASSIGLCTNAIGVFYTPVSKSLHVLKGTFAMHATLSTLITALTSLKMSKLIRKYNYKKILLIGVLLSSLFFGFSQAAGNVLQNTSLKTQITASIPYVATIVALILFSIQNKRKKKNK